MITIKPVTLNQRAATFEVDHGVGAVYHTPYRYAVLLNGVCQFEGDTNVFTLFHLSPSMFYEVRLEFENGEAVVYDFITPAETMFLDVTRFGAVGDGVTENTNALQAALEACAPGGTVYVPAGVYLTYPLFLQSDVLLYLDKDAVLLGGTERCKYPILPGMVQTEDGEISYGTWEGNPLDCFAALLTCVDKRKVTVAGEGIVNGNAQNADWWEDCRTRRGAWRPRTVFAVRTCGFTLQGITVQNSPSWTVHPYYCKDVDVIDIFISNPAVSPNTDGCNPECCENVRILGTRISVGDDCIAVKSGKYYMAATHYTPTKNVQIRNCRLMRGHGGVVLGSEIASGVAGLMIDRCLMENTDRGVRIKTRRGRGETSVLRQIQISRIKMKDVLTPFVVNMFYFCDPDGHSGYVRTKEKLPVNELTPRIHNLVCTDIDCDGAATAGVFFYGLPESPIESVVLKNVHVRFAKDTKPGLPAMMDDIEPVEKLALYVNNVRSLKLQNVTFEGYEGEMLQMENVGEFINE